MSKMGGGGMQLSYMPMLPVTKVTQVTQLCCVSTDTIMVIALAQHR